MNQAIVPLKAGKEIAAIVPTNTTEIGNVARMIVNSGLAPYGLKKQGEIEIAIMAGLEVGLSPLNAVNSIAVINGKPSMYGDVLLALILGSGLLKGIEETLEGKGDDFKAVCVVTRKEPAMSTHREFSVADAKVANLWDKSSANGKPSPWKLYPKRMLQMRARAFALRDTFPDVLKGIHCAEEVQDYTAKQETKVVEVHELLEEPIETVEVEELEALTQSRVAEILETIDLCTEENFPEFRKQVIAEIKDKADSPMRQMIGEALREKTEIIKNILTPEDAPEAEDPIEAEFDEETGEITPDAEPDEPESAMPLYTAGELIGEAANCKTKNELEAFYLNNVDNIASFTEGGYKTVMAFKTEQLEKFKTGKR